VTSPWTFPLGWPTELSIDHAIAAIAEVQHGVIGLWQLTALGLSGSGVRHRVAVGRLHRVHRGVYAVGHGRLTRRARWAAAALAFGPRAWLAEISAAHHLGLSSWSSTAAHVLVPERRCRSREGIVVHTGPLPPAEEVIVHEGIACTSWARTVLDLAARRPPRLVEKALDLAESTRVFDMRELEATLSRGNAPRPGSAVIRRILGTYRVGENLQRSDAEELMLAICAAHDLPSPRSNFWMKLGEGLIEADFFWPEAKLVVEVDGFAHHGTRNGFRSDRMRDRNLFLNSDLALLRFAAEELVEQPARVASDIERMLERRTHRRPA
jgi:very-short-patch-repair endonuclease/predicted transcriptional regulator of viral defense system